ncbi:MAG: adenylyltransferase/cytidyltransferase family protein [Actinomycetota bacterium]|nr:adenylyltransferase/cytidyltransferase family protein [Actinomycetota bacterium]
MRIGYAPGVYALFHVEHLNILRHAKSLCGHLIAGAVSDEMAELAKGRRPVVPLAERLEILKSIRYVHQAHAEMIPDKVDTWREIGFDIIFKGDDWRGTAKGRKLEADFAAVGVDVIYFPYTVDTSSTLLRRVLTAIDAGSDPDAAVLVTADEMVG